MRATYIRPVPRRAIAAAALVLFSFTGLLLILLAVWF